MVSIVAVLGVSLAGSQTSEEVASRAALQEARAFGERDPRFAPAAHNLGTILLVKHLEASLRINHRDVVTCQVRLVQSLSLLRQHPGEERSCLSLSRSWNRYLAEASTGRRASGGARCPVSDHRALQGVGEGSLSRDQDQGNESW